MRSWADLFLLMELIMKIMVEFTRILLGHLWPVELDQCVWGSAAPFYLVFKQSILLHIFSYILPLLHFHRNEKKKRIRYNVEI